MTPEMKAFLNEFADLMERHHITEMMVVEAMRAWDTNVSGIEFTMADSTDEAGVYHPVEFFMMHGTYNDVKTIRDDAKEI